MAPHFEEKEQYDDFKPYIDAVKAAGERTRSVTYVNIVLIALAIALVRSYVYPSWDHREFKNARAVTQCIANLYVEQKTSKNVNIISKKSEAECDVALMNRFHLHLRRDENNNEFSLQDISIGSGSKDYDKENPYIKFVLKSYMNEVDNRTSHEFFRIPIFDVEFHENDAWILTGVFGSTALLLLRAFLNRELITIQKISEIIPNDKCRFLVLSTQVFATPLKKNDNLAWFVRSFAFLLLFFMQPVLHLMLIWHDLFDDTDRSIILNLLGPSGAVMEHVFRILALATLCWLGVKCWTANYKIDNIIRYIEDAPYPLRTKH